MNEILNNYLHSFLHPWHTQELLRSKRNYNSEVESSSQLELVEKRESKHISDEVGVSFEQSLIVSWMFVIFNAIYSLIGIFMGVHLFESFSVSNTFISYSQSLIGFTSIFFLILKVVFFPLFFWFYGKFWVNLIKIFSGLFEKEGDAEVIGLEIVSQAFTSHTLLVIPIVGLLLHRVINLVYLFGGLRKNLDFSVMQATLVLLCPIFLVLFSVFLMTVSVGMMLSGF
ncbi:MAG: hypothetical protein K9K67_14170 [Bacteriovoracaceae bacterium]|nr:hypothetical protein [Bacteriovoracaceae bacterium]